MDRPPLFDLIDRDLACAIALGFVEHPQVAANLHAVTLLSPQGDPLGSQPDWLSDDPLDEATRRYLAARADAVRAGGPGGRPGPWAAAGAAQKRDEANARACTAKAQARALIDERGVLALARERGLRVLG